MGARRNKGPEYVTARSNYAVQGEKYAVREAMREKRAVREAMHENMR